MSRVELPAEHSPRKKPRHPAIWAPRSASLDDAHEDVCYLQRIETVWQGVVRVVASNRMLSRSLGAQDCVSRSLPCRCPAGARLGVPRKMNEGSL